jgi:predicted ATPase
MSNAIKTLSIEGFKSIRSLKDFELHRLNILIGANGAGKGNFVSFFRLLRELIEKRFQIAVRTTEGGAGACLYLGPQVTARRRAIALPFADASGEFRSDETGAGPVI